MSESKFRIFLNSIKAEFRRENFSLSFEKNNQFQKDPEEVLEYFHSCIWPFCNRLVYLIYRIGIAVYYSIWFIESIVRNYEFRAKNLKILTGEQKKSLLLHPWPFYMTSWSLALLFIHLWLSAFIVLYFYTIDKKSCLTSFFSFLFGPFSCSRSNHVKAQRTNDNNSQRFYSKVFNCFKSTPSNKSSQIAQEDNKENHELNNSADENTDLNINMNKLEIVDKDSFNNINNNNIIDCDEELKLSKTYCSNKSKCQLPSSKIMSDSASWQLWINVHVPTFILILMKISWLLYNLIVISAILVTIGYFTYVNLNGLKMEPSWITEIGNLHRHGVNSIVAIVDIILMAYPVRILHFVYTSLYGWTYAIVVFIYWIQNPKENIIYEQIDYNKPFMLMGYYSLLTILTFILQTLHYLAYRFKLYLKEKYLEVKFNFFK